MKKRNVIDRLRGSKNTRQPRETQRVVQDTTKRAGFTCGPPGPGHRITALETRAPPSHGSLSLLTKCKPNHLPQISRIS